LLQVLRFILNFLIATFLTCVYYVFEEGAVVVMIIW